ncbi:hypothetical protein C8N26_1975 [Tenacibaculum lutimaris]|uniref:Uncharacterized protein n=1 Tax=Tenacibaculum lutimaris TaxID=285258 RepID=A0A420E0E8_9FLAO|nr:hypothetical protein [Tenacibaculum lutimaris]RKF03585.1 hypothetical protein C8N26_1975 [Tenacibaculum lutimaris]
MVDKNIKIGDFKELLNELKYINLNSDENYINSLNSLLLSVMQFDSRKDLFEMVVEELELVRKKGLEEYLKKRPDLNKQSYIDKTFIDRVIYWSGRLHQQMRWQVESGLDPYSIYTPEWYQSTKKFETNFDKIMDEVFSKYWGTGADWSKEEYLKRIKNENN